MDGGLWGIIVLLGGVAVMGLILAFWPTKNKAGK